MGALQVATYYPLEIKVFMRLLSAPIVLLHLDHIPSSIVIASSFNAALLHVKSSSSEKSEGLK